MVFWARALHYNAKMHCNKHRFIAVDACYLRKEWSYRLECKVCRVYEYAAFAMYWQMIAHWGVTHLDSHFWRLPDVHYHRPTSRRACFIR